MINPFGSSKRKSEFENANKGLTRLAGRQTDFLDKEWGHGSGFRHATKENKRKMALLALNSFSFQVKNKRFIFQELVRVRRTGKSRFTFWQLVWVWKDPMQRCRNKKFCKRSKKTDWIQWKIFKQNKNFYNKRIARKFLQVPKRVLVKLAVKEKVWNSGLGWSHCRHLIFSQRGRPLAVLKKRWQKETQD